MILAEHLQGTGRRMMRRGFGNYAITGSMLGILYTSETCEAGEREVSRSRNFPARFIRPGPGYPPLMTGVSDNSIVVRVLATRLGRNHFWRRG